MPPPLPRLDRSFFARPAVAVARDLLGQRLIRIAADGTRLGGVIVETEAYAGPHDLGCHAKSGRTRRNASLWGPPGRAYVYFTYGMHWLLNVVTESEGVAAATLIRAIAPSEGGESMIRNRGVAGPSLADGPAKLCQALGIDGAFDGHDLCAPEATLFVERGVPVPDQAVLCGPRVGLGRVPEPWRSVPWRFRILAAPSPTRRRPA